MKEVLEVIARALVDEPDEVNIAEAKSDDRILLEIKVAQPDVGKIIGRQGRIIKAIRTVAKSLGQREGKRVSFELWQ
jgi:predicted RNA-binding protein YlqC (UPF0109 family)